MDIKAEMKKFTKDLKDWHKENGHIWNKLDDIHVAKHRKMIQAKLGDQ